MSKELAMLSPGLLPLYDRDKGGRRRSNRRAPVNESASLEAESDRRDTAPRDENLVTPLLNLNETPPPNGRANERAALLETDAGGDIAAELENSNNDTEPQFTSPVPAKGNGRRSFQAIDPINVTLPFDVLKSTFENQMMCPNPECLSQDDDYNHKHTLEVTQNTHGFATELFIKCKACG